MEKKIVKARLKQTRPTKFTGAFKGKYEYCMLIYIPSFLYVFLISR